MTWCTESPRSCFEPFGIGTDTAAEILVVVGDNPERIKSEAALAKLAGIAPVSTGSGMTSGRQRINHGGHRQLNAAIYRTVIVRMRFHQPTIDYVARRTAEGKTKHEIIRGRKRYVTQVELATAEWIDWYCHRQLHREIGGTSHPPNTRPTTTAQPPNPRSQPQSEVSTEPETVHPATSKIPDRLKLAFVALLLAQKLRVEVFVGQAGLIYRLGCGRGLRLRLVLALLIRHVIQSARWRRLTG
ncbi:transposase [Streptomyces sp. So13.3]|uniref:transposase n=1 Tax=Streptomyces sp. So13.3 TaxID=2136173 RepID=UPI0011075506|nr:transposase [Streptomyces sp. So13.3]QNA75405.1 transposase [Streptomyces sp. So13.3]